MKVDGRGIYRKFGMRVNYEMNYWWKKENIKKIKLEIFLVIFEEKKNFLGPSRPARCGKIGPGRAGPTKRKNCPARPFL